MGVPTSPRFRALMLPIPQEIGIGENDLWIVATALRHSLIIVTSDSDFKRMRQVREFPVESCI